MMNYLIVKISGADLLDKILAKRKPGYEEYMARTNRFIPKFFNPPDLRRTSKTATQCLLWSTT